MVYKRFTLLLILRLILILINLFCIAFLYFILEKEQLIFSFIILFSILIIQIVDLVRFITRTNRELNKFLNSIKQSDYTLKYPVTETRSSLSNLHRSFNTILETFEKIKIEKETQFQFLQMVVEHIRIGIIVINENKEIILMNSTAERLLGVYKTRTWRQLSNKSNAFTSEVDTLAKGGRTLIEIDINRENVIFSLQVFDLLLMEKPHRLITFQNIHSEIEQKETEAWIRLIRVLNHEIMNSVTPISSLTETILMLLEDQDHNQIPDNEINTQIISDIIGSVKTIQKRSDGLYEFVNEYRKLTRIPSPVYENINVDELVEEIFQLMQGELEKRSITFKMEIEKNLTIRVDKKLIEQVMLNLIKNSIQALPGTVDPELMIRGYTADEHATIQVIDNGHGIEPGLLEEIFIPFFSTKDDGSGIGLALSRQIMRLHGGRITARSTPFKETCFELVF